MEVFYVFFGFFMIMFVGVLAAVIAMTIYKTNEKNKKSKGDYLTPRPEEEKKSYDPFSDYKVSAAEKTEAKPVEKPAEKPLEKAAVKPVEAPAEKPSPVHANCDHAKKPTPYIDINDTYSMVWDEFKSFALKLLSAEYPSAKYSPYRYRGSPDIQLETGGKSVDVRLIFVRENTVVDKGDFDAALKDIYEKDDVADWIITNGRFSVMQRGAANGARVTLYDADDMFAMMRRCNVSAKPNT